MDSSSEFENGSSTLVKRKAENPQTVDSAASEDKGKQKEKEYEEEEEEEEKEDEEEDEEDDEIMDTDSCDADQEWDVDSFKDEVFNSDDEPDEDWRRYVRQIYKSEGFDVGFDDMPKHNPERIILSKFAPVKLDEYYFPPDLTGRQYMEKMVNVVIKKYNESKGKNLVLDHIVKTVAKFDGGIKGYITFMAKESPEGELVEYQGKAHWKPWQRNIHPLLCRPASEQRLAV